MTDDKNKKNTTKTVAEQIWMDIKDLDLKMFSLPNQKVNQYCKPVDVDPNKLFLTTNVSSTLPALELVLPSKYSIERQDKFLIVSLNSLNK